MEQAKQVRGLAGGAKDAARARVGGVRRRVPGATRLENAVLALPAVAALIFFGMWRLLDRREEAAARRRIEHTASQAALRLQDYIGARLLVVESLAREASAGLLADEESFVMHAATLQAQLGGLLAINRIDAGGRIEWVSPREPNQRAIGKNVFEHPDAAPAAQRAKAEEQPAVTQPLVLFQGVKGFASYFPVHGAYGAYDGFVNGVFDAAALVQAALHDRLLEDYSVDVRDAGMNVFTTPGYDDAAPAIATHAVRVMDRSWQIAVRPSAATWERLRPRRQDLWLALLEGGCLVAGVLVWSWRRARVVRRRLESELRRANKMEALGRFAGGVAHDMNNLLTAVTGNAELALTEPGLPPDAREALDEVLSVARRGAEMTRSLLAFSRSEAVVPQLFDPARQIQALLPMLRHLIRRDHEVQTELPEGLGAVRMDPTQLDQILLNLVVNAVDATPEGGRITIRVRRAPRVDRADGLVVEVEDDGVGIPAANLEAIFEPFFSTKEHKGTGLGLAQVWDCAQRAGGRVSVRSEEGKGACFQVWLPLVVVPQSGERKNA